MIFRDSLIDCWVNSQSDKLGKGTKLTNRRQFSMVYLTNRFHVAVHLFSNRSQMTSKCDKNKKVAHEAQRSVSLMSLPHFNVICDLLLNRRSATWNIFVLFYKEANFVNGDVSYASVLQ